MISERPDLGSNPALRTALTDLVRDGVLSPGQADAVAHRLSPLWATPTALTAATLAAHSHGENRTRTRIVEIAGYVGGAMVLGGAATIVVPTWGSFPPVARFLLAMVATIVLAAGAVAARFARLGDDTLAVRMRLASVLGALASGAVATAAAVPASDSAEVLAGTVAALLLAVPGYALFRGAPLLFTGWLAGALLIGDLLDRAGIDDILPWGIAYAVFGAFWMLLAIPLRVSPIREPGVAALLGGLTGLGAAEAITTDSLPDDGPLLAIVGLIVGVAFAAGCFGLYLATRRWPALVPAVLIALVVPATALAQILGSLLAAGFAVAVVGLLLLVAGGIALMSRRPGGAPAASGHPPVAPGHS
ncbi:hypothetical protein [Cryptosporangium aurantiacum]|uniref:DUF2157 domain-containing protein n=1 Tax=Cryptosporangium aurantiacum TaxID=134849 RepID=A0A1M7RH83_9ACTN|nr:hypothetical protein [Cryptosporangium aurantiacum]SHN45614.1 hypothetical protein SAMN05443668_112150 [Cryptosporangium aurantiacum]